MLQNQQRFIEKAAYFFKRVKETHRAKTGNVVTVYVRLSKEVIRISASGESVKTEPVWEDMYTVAENEMSEKIKTIQNGLHVYCVSRKIFQELATVSASELSPVLRTV